MSSTANYMFPDGTFAHKSEISGSERVNGTLTLQNGGNTVTHSIGSNGVYNVQDEAGMNLLTFNNDNSLGDCALNQHINDQVGSVSSVVSVHTSTLESHNATITAQASTISALQSTVSGLIAGAPVYSTYSGTIASNTTSTLNSYTIANNNIGFLEGYIITDFSNRFFKVFCKNVSGTASVISWTVDGYQSGTDDFSWTASTNRINIRFTNSNISTTKYSLAYIPTFMAI